MNASKRILRGLLFLGLVVAIVLYATGMFQGERVPPGRVAAPAGESPPAVTARAEKAEVDVFEAAMGTVESRTRVGVAAQVTARVLKIAARAGESVRAGETLLTLDDRQHKARLAQARNSATAADAAHRRAVEAKPRAAALLKQTKARYDRFEKLVAKKALTSEELEGAESAYLQAVAGVAEATAAIAAAEARTHQAAQVVTEAEIALDHCRVLAPIDGVVQERSVEPGDLALPGRTLLVVLDANALRLEARVREGLISRIREGETLQVQIPAAHSTVTGTVDEIIPAADPLSRTFRVRIDFAPVAGVHPGMFGRLRIPVGRRMVVKAPARAVRRVGQLEEVVVKVGEDRWERRLVTTGLVLEPGVVEILSGLGGGETLGIMEQP